MSVSRNSARVLAVANSSVHTESHSDVSSVGKEASVVDQHLLFIVKNYTTGRETLQLWQMWKGSIYMLHIFRNIRESTLEKPIQIDIYW